MRRLLTLIFLAAVAVPAAAQEPPRPPRQPADTGEVRAYRFNVGPEDLVLTTGRRGRLGVVVNLLAEPATDSIGARIGGVTPDGPADKAGVRAGDIVVRLNGARLARGSGDEDDASAPGRRLVELASRLHTGDTVHIELRRDGKPVNVTLLAGPSGVEDLVRSFSLRAMPQPARVPFGRGEMELSFDASPLANLELVKVNPGLGEYFGTPEGVLVVSTPGDSTLGLRAGDVILSIGGRKPNNPSHVFRILGTYDSGETVAFELMRMKHRISVTGKMPASRGWRAMPNAFEFDLTPQGWDHPDLRGWSDQSPLMLQLPELQILKALPQPPIRLRPAKQLTVST